MFQTKKLVLYILGIASVVGLICLVRRQRGEQGSLPIWQSVLARRYGAEKSQQLMAVVRQRRTELTAATTLPQNQALRWHLTENILPGLALYQVLLQVHGGDQTAALAEVDEAMRTWTLAKNRARFALLKLMPAPFSVFKLVFAQTMKKFPAEGWETTYVENSADRVAFNMTRCFYLNTLTAYGAPELTPSFCKNDEVMAELFPPSLRFVRPHTLGRGDALCDFQYCRVKQP
jgi:hypothetical protein